MTTAAIDIGNTRTKIGVFIDDNLVEQQVWTDWTLKSLQYYLNNHSVEKLIYTTVIQLSVEIASFFDTESRCIQLTHQLNVPFKNTYTTPQTLGRDRIAAVAGAIQLFPDENCLIIDAGTCITYDFLTDKRIYLGGNISPGLQMRLKAMHQFTAALPLVELKAITTKIGDTTTTAMQIGGLWGAVLEMDGTIAWATAKNQEIKVILTGGDSNFFANHLKSKIFAQPNLVLIGLNKILRYNAL